jgi:hypothetical protein
MRPQPFTWTWTPAPPVDMPGRPPSPYRAPCPCVPVSPALPAGPLQPWRYEDPIHPGLPLTVTCAAGSSPGVPGAVAYEDPTHPGLPPYPTEGKRPGGDF